MLDIRPSGIIHIFALAALHPSQNILLEEPRVSSFLKATVEYNESHNLFRICSHSVSILLIFSWINGVIVRPRRNLSQKELRMGSYFWMHAYSFHYFLGDEPADHAERLIKLAVTGDILLAISSEAYDYDITAFRSKCVEDETQHGFFREASFHTS